MANLEKVAYTAIGAPIAGAKAIKDRAAIFAETVKQKRGVFRSDFARELEGWIAEGEVVVDRMFEWIRSTGANSELRSAGRSAAETKRSGGSRLSHSIDQGLDVIEPEIDLTEVRGIGAASADKLAKAAVTGIGSLLAMTRNESDRERLSAEIGVGVGTIEGWRSEADLTRVAGIGESYQRMLHTIGIGTITQLASADPQVRAKEMSAIDQPGMPNQDPGRSAVAGWVKEARRMSLRNRN